MKFKDILKELRTEKGLSHMKLGKAIGVSASSIGYWELGKTDPKSEYLLILAEFFGVTVGQLLGVEELR